MKNFFQLLFKVTFILLSIFFFIIALIGSKEWIIHMFINKDGKAWLDWYFYLPMMFFSISVTFYISFIFLSYLIRKKIVFNFINIMASISAISCFSYAFLAQIIFIRGYVSYSIVSSLLFHFLLPIVMGLFIIFFTLFSCKKARIG